MTTSTAPASAVRFADFYSRAQYLAHWAHYGAQPKNASGSPEHSSSEYQTWSKQFGAGMDEFNAAIGQFLIAKRDAGELPLVEFTGRRRHQWCDAWNRLVSNKVQTWDMGILTGDLAHGLETAASMLVKDFDSRPERYDAMCKVASYGTMPYFVLNARSTCAISGEQLCAELKHWAPTLGVCSRDAAEKFTLIREHAPKPDVAHIVIDAPSGELLVADWFRIDGFTETVDAGRPVALGGSLAANLWSARTYAAEHNFMSVVALDAYPTVLARDGMTVFVREDDDPAGLQGLKVGTVFTDLWAVSAIDRQVLTDIIAKKCERAEAERRVADYLAHNDVMTTRVSPGNLHIYHSAPFEAMNRFTCPEVDTTGAEELNLVISERELKWTPRALATSAPAPVTVSAAEVAAADVVPARRPRLR
jgi:hypothetical protein